MSEFKKINVSDIKKNPYQPRTNFNEKDLESLKQSIEENGLLQPITVRKSVFGYTLIAGERRWRAFKSLNRSKIDAIVKECQTKK